MLIEAVSTILPQLNKTFGKNGVIRDDLVMAFQRSGLSYDKDTLPVVKFEGNSEYIDLLFHNPGQYNFRVKKVKTLFGEQTSEIVVHPQSLIENMEKKMAGKSYGQGGTFRDGLLLASLEIVIDTIVADSLNYDQEAFEIISHSVLREFKNIMHDENSFT